MRILLSISNLWTGGAQTLLVSLAESLTLKHSVYIYEYELSDRRAENTVINRIPSGVKIIYLPNILARTLEKVDTVLFRFGFQLSLLEFVKRLHFRKAVAKYKIDIINTHLYHSDRFVATCLRNSVLPIVLTDHGDYRYIVERGIASFDDILMIIHRVDAIIYPSASNAEALSKYTVGSKAIKKTIYYGFSFPSQQKHPESARQKLRIPSQAFVFGMVARGICEKGWAEAIQAFGLVRSWTQTELYLILVGESDYLHSLKQELNAVQKSVIHFVGHSSEPTYWIEAFDIALLPTYFPGESLPFSVIEYLSSGKPVVATSVGGIQEMIDVNKDQQAGILIKLDRENKVDVQLLAEAMLRYVNDARLLTEHSRLAKQASGKFKLEICLRRYEGLFVEVLRKNLYQS
jgi:glycosyltransferase involved in cell wall biosynthesis